MHSALSHKNLRIIPNTEIAAFWEKLAPLDKYSMNYQDKVSILRDGCK